MEDVSMMDYKFRIYDFDKKTKDEVFDILSDVLDRFYSCEVVQIEITAPDRNSESVKKKKAEVKGFAG